MTGQSNFLQSLGWAVLNSLWQLALLWVAYQCITSLLKKSTAPFKSSLASGLLIAGFAWFVYTFLAVYLSSSPDKTIIEHSFINITNNEPVNEWLQQALPIASIIYLIMLALPLLRFIRNYRYVQIIRKYGLTKIGVEWKIFVKNVARLMGIRKPVTIWVSELVSSPVTIGFLKPIILVPLAAINHLTPQQLEAILLHELSHIKRYDYLINLLLNFIKTVLYFNPFVKAFVKVVEKEREKSCDDMVLQFQYDSYEYATALLMLEKANRFDKPLIVGATGKKNDLLNRVETIMGINKQPVFSFNKLAGLLAGLVCIVSLNIFLSIKEGAGNRILAFSPVSFPYNIQADENATTERAAQIVNTSKVAKNNTGTAQQRMVKFTTPITAQLAKLSPVSFANFEMPDATEMAELDKQQEEQVKQALEASKKVMASAQWKEVEKTIAEVFTQQEKQDLESTYEKEINKINWQEWENKLRVAYDKVNWDKVNYQLSNAVTQVRMDSLQKVYNIALSKYDHIQKELKANNVKGIPDTDITLAEIDQKKKEAQKAINNIKAIRNKKIVSL